MYGSGNLCVQKGLRRRRDVDNVLLQGYGNYTRDFSSKGPSIICFAVIIMLLDTRAHKPRRTFCRSLDLLFQFTSMRACENLLFRNISGSQTNIQTKRKLYALLRLGLRTTFQYLNRACSIQLWHYSNIRGVPTYQSIT